MNKVRTALLAGALLTASLLSLLPTPRAAAKAEAGAGTKAQYIQTLYYSRGVMERVFRNHANPAFARTGDYVPGLYRRRDANCLTAVNWNTRHLVRQNAVLVIELWDKVQRRWEIQRCQASDWQQLRHSTGSRQRFEVDYETAVRVNMLNGNTVARLIRVDLP